MKCTECKTSFHWNYGDHRSYPLYKEHKMSDGTVHDFQEEEMKYTPDQAPHF